MNMAFFGGTGITYFLQNNQKSLSGFFTPTFFVKKLGICMLKYKHCVYAPQI